MIEDFTIEHRQAIADEYCVENFITVDNELVIILKHKRGWEMWYVGHFNREDLIKWLKVRTDSEG